MCGGVLMVYKIVAEANQNLGVENSTMSVAKKGKFENNLDRLERLQALFEKDIFTVKKILS